MHDCDTISGRRRERNHFRIACWESCKADPLCLGDAVLSAQVAVGFHRQRAAVLVSDPAGDGRDINATLNAGSGEQMPQIVMGDARQTHFAHRAVNRVLGLIYTEHLCVEPLIRTLASHPCKERPRIGNHRHPAYRPISRTGCRRQRQGDSIFRNGLTPIRPTLLNVPKRRPPGGEADQAICPCASQFRQPGEFFLA